MEESVLHLTTTDLMHCLRTSRRQGFVAGVCFVLAVRAIFTVRDQMNANKTTTTK